MRVMSPVPFLVLCLSQAEPWIDRLVAERAEAVGEPDAEGIPVSGRELALPKQHFLFARQAFFQGELVPDAFVLPELFTVRPFNSRTLMPPETVNRVRSGDDSCCVKTADALACPRAGSVRAMC